MNRTSIFEPDASDVARRELDAALQLLAQRARFMTGALSAVIALRDGERMICRASVGPGAAPVGIELKMNSERAASSGRVLVKPLVREQEVLGVVELSSDRDPAFVKSDVAVLERISQLSLTALELAEAAERAMQEVAASTDETAVPAPTGPSFVPDVTLLEPPQPPEPVAKPFPKIGSCQACGFPVSPGRKLCVDCEQARQSDENIIPPANGDCPEFLSQLADAQQQSWLQVDVYTVGTALVAVLTVILLVLKYR